jgi:hypothetical protein
MFISRKMVAACEALFAFAVYQGGCAVIAADIQQLQGYIGHYSVDDLISASTAASSNRIRIQTNTR